MQLLQKVTFPRLKFSIKVINIEYLFDVHGMQKDLRVYVTDIN